MYFPQNVKKIFSDNWTFPNIYLSEVNETFSRIIQKFKTKRFD